MGGTTVKYYVVLPDGQRFGPADVALLNQWAAEGRILPQTMLEEESTQTRMPATSVPGLALASAVPSYGSPTGSPTGVPQNGPQNFSGYYRGPVVMGDNGQSDITMAWVFGGISIVACICTTFLGIGLGIAGVIFANRAATKGHPSAQAAKIFCWVMLCIQIAVAVLGIVLAVVMSSQS